MNEKLEQEMDSAAAALKRVGAGPKQETRYMQAYQALVQAGLRPQLRRKYRG